MEQSNIFDVLYETYKPKNKIKLIELFAGIGSQAKALEYLGLDFETHKIVEWSIPSIIAYYQMHSKDKKDYSKELSKEQICDFLFEKGVSKNYNEPATIAQIKRIKEETLRECYNAIISTNNLVNIMSTKGSDLEIENTDEYDYIMTYSFPCQDLSLAGNRKGMSRDGNSRSGMLWEVERLLKETKNLPQILLMENVPQVIGQENINNFNEWQLFLEKLGYSNYTQNLIATDYGIPQGRKRTFMISILGDYRYNFPKKMELKYTKDDFLEKNVSDNYYLKEKDLLRILDWKSQQKPLEQVKENKPFIKTITARGAGEDHSGMILVKEEVKQYENYITWEDKKGRMNTQDHRAYNKKIVGTIPATERGVPNIIVEDCLFEEGEVIDYTASKRFWSEKKNKDIIPTLKTSNHLAVVIKIQNKYYNVRKITENESFIFMGFLDKDYNKLKLSKSQKYHIAGDSIVTTNLMAVFGKLFNIDYETKINELVEKLKENK